MRIVTNPTLSDVARCAGVSATAASWVLNREGSGVIPISEATRRRILAAAKQLNYVCDARARILRKQRSPIVGVLLDGLGGVFRPHLLSAISTRLAQRAKEVLLGVHLGDIAEARRHVETFCSYRTSGVVTIHAVDTVPDEIVQILEDGRNYCGGHVSITVTTPGADVTTVAIDNGDLLDRFLRLAVADRRRCVMLAGLPHKSFFDRLSQLFREQSRRYPKLDAETLKIECGTSQRFAQHLLPVLRARCRKGPLALLVTGDFEAMETVRALKEVGLSVPRDVAVMTYWNQEIAERAEPAITSFDVLGAAPEMTTWALEAIDEIEGGSEPEPRQHLIQPEIIIRETFVPPANAV